MSPEIIAAIVGVLSGLGGLIGALTIYIKQRTKLDATRNDIQAIATSRVETAERRDREMQDLRETVTKNTWNIDQLKNEMSHRDTLLDDLRAQVAALNTSLAVVGQKIDTLTDAIRELKEQRQ